MAPTRDVMHEAVAALRRVDIAAPEQRIAQYPHQMSGGMKQRVVGAIAMSGQPEVLIADEPTTALDVTIQLQYLKLLKRLQHESGMAILFITHDFGVVGADVRPGGGDVCRPHRRMRAGATGVRAPVASLHPGADRLGAADFRHRGRLDHDRGPAAVAAEPAGRAAASHRAVPSSISDAATSIRAVPASATSTPPIAGRSSHDNEPLLRVGAPAQVLSLHQGRAVRPDDRRGEGGGRRLVHHRRGQDARPRR